MNMTKTKQFISINKILIIVLPFLLAWMAFVTASSYLNRAAAQEAKELAQTNTKLAQETANGNNKVIDQKISAICLDIDALKRTIEDLQKSLASHERENAEAQRKMYELLLNINKNMSRK